MKRIVFILLVLASFTASAQYDSTRQRQTNNSYGFDFKNLKTTGSNIIPLDTPKLAVKDSGGIAYKDGFIWTWNGYKWILQAGGVIINTGSVDSVTYSSNELCQWVDGVSTCYRLNKFFDSLSISGSKIIFYNNGIARDSGTISGGSGTLQSAADSSFAAGDNPVLNFHGQTFIIDSAALLRIKTSRGSALQVGNTISGNYVQLGDLDINGHATQLVVDDADSSINLNGRNLKMPYLKTDTSGSRLFVTIDTITNKTYRQPLPVDTFYLKKPLYAINDTIKFKNDSLPILKYASRDTTTWDDSTLTDKKYLEDRIAGIEGGGGGVSQSVISDTLKNYANSGSLTTDNVLYSTPIALSVANHLLTGAFALKSQSAYTLFGRGSGSGTPSFLSSIDSNWVTGLHSEAYYNTKYSSIVNNSWLLTGVSGTDSSINFLGTKDEKPLIFRVRNVRAGFIGQDSLTGNTTFGLYAAPSLSRQDSSSFYSDRFNTAVGNQALQKLHSPYVKTGLANFNAAFGHQAAYNTTTGNGNVAIGAQSLYSNIAGCCNMAIGHNALFYTTSSNSVGIGESAGYANTTGRLTAIGSYALSSSTTVNGNTAIGYLSAKNTTGTDNTAIGENALYSNTSGIRNVAIGSGTMYYGSDASYNNGIGYGAIQKSTGSYNVAFGSFAGIINTSGTNNVFIGYNAGASTFLTATKSNQLFISSDSTKNLITGDFSTGQVQINSAKVPVLKSSVAFDVPSTTMGFLPPVMTKTQRNAIASPAPGLMVIVTGETGGEYLSWYNSDTSGWVKVTSTAD